MSGDLPESDRTIIRLVKPPEPAAPLPAAPPPAERTVIATGASGLQGTPPVSAPPSTSLGAAVMAPRVDGSRIQVGDVLNHIFEVKRFLARGGMGEVYEGINVNSDERVAIKVILPQLAADPNVQAMFRREARTLTRLSHPALVQYRVLAQEPQLGVYYIVTEYIDGTNLSDVLTQIEATPAQLLALTRRLAEGLSAAHALGAIHRDMSPDNVLLEDGRLDRARIIDFGIAKDLDPGSKTIIGDGFAGKLGYVAPEQLGDFDREVGPWSDVYSLGLLILAVAQRRNVDMGASFVEAIDRRRKGADTSTAPPEIRGVLDRMLTPDPAARLRSMAEVITALDAPVAMPGKAATRAKAAADKAALVKTTSKLTAKPATAGSAVALPTAGKAASATGTAFAGNRGLIIGGSAATLLAVAGAAYFVFKPASPPVAVVTANRVAHLAGPSPADAARAAVNATLPGLSCTWLDLTAVVSKPDGISLALDGVAGHPAEAEAAIARAAAGTGVHIAATDFTEVAPLSGSECASIDAFRAIRAGGLAHLSVPQRKFELSTQPPGSPFAGKLRARTIINLALADPSLDFAVYGIEPSGAISSLIPDRHSFAKIPKTGTPIADLGGDRYRLQIDADHSGWSGIILLTGRGGFADPLVVTGPGERSAAWQQKFAAAAAANGWRAEMVWFKMVDEIKD